MWMNHFVQPFNNSHLTNSCFTLPPPPLYKNIINYHQTPLGIFPFVIQTCAPYEHCFRTTGSLTKTTVVREKTSKRQVTENKPIFEGSSPLAVRV